MRSATLLFGRGDQRGLDAAAVSAFAAGYRAVNPLTDEQVADAVHRLWWERVCDLWQLKQHYERHDTACDHLFISASALLDWFGHACPWKLDCEGCGKFVLSGADLMYWRRKRDQWTSLAERAPDDATADYLHQVFAPTAAIDGRERALAGLGLLDQALALDLRRPQDYFPALWNTGFRPRDLAELADQPEHAKEQDAG